VRRTYKAITRLIAAILRRERARLDGFAATDADALVEASIRFQLEGRIARRWLSILGGHVGSMFRITLNLPSDLIEAPTSSAVAAPMGLRIVR
jgi:hypothetical protein